MNFSMSRALMTHSWLMILHMFTYCELQPGCVTAAVSSPSNNHDTVTIAMTDCGTHNAIHLWTHTSLFNQLNEQPAVQDADNAKSSIFFKFSQPLMVLDESEENK